MREQTPNPTGAPRESSPNQLGSPRAGISDIDELGPAVLLIVILRRWKLLAAFQCAAFLVGVLYWQFAEPVFRSSATFLPSSKLVGDDTAAGLGALQSAALSLGVSVSSGKADPTLLFADVLRGAESIRSIVNQEFPLASGDSVVLSTRLVGDRRDPKVQLYKAEKKFRARVLRVSTDIRTGLVTVSIDLPDPALARDVCTAALARVEDFAQEIRSEHATRRVEFVEARLTTTRELLRTEEDRLLDFRTKNRVLSDSPDLRAAETRLVRGVRVQEEVFVSLSTQLELAKIDREQDFPAISVVDRPVIAPYKSAPRLGKSILLSCLVLGALSLAAVYLVEYVREQRSPLARELWSRLSVLPGGRVPRASS